MDPLPCYRCDEKFLMRPVWRLSDRGRNHLDAEGVTITSANQKVKGVPMFKDLHQNIEGRVLRPILTTLPLPGGCSPSSRKVRLPFLYQA